MPDLRFSTDDPAELTEADIFILRAAMLAPDEPGLQTLMALADHALAAGDPAPGEWLIGGANCQRRLFHGMLVGYAVGNAMRQPGRPLGEIVDEATAELSKVAAARAAVGMPSQPRVSLKTFNNVVFPAFRPAAALWAAHIHAATDLGLRSFPCSLPDMPRFLALADWYVVTAGKTKSTPTSPGTILDLSDCLRPSADLRAALPSLERDMRN